MIKYREIEEAWERKQEEKDTAKRIAAAKKRVEEEVKVGYSAGQHGLLCGTPRTFHRFFLRHRVLYARCVVLVVALG